MFSFLQKVLKPTQEQHNYQNNPRSKEDIFIEQIQNYIDTEQGYELVRQKLINEINQNQCFDSIMMVKLVKLISNNLTSLSREKVQRTIHVLEDLVQHCSIMSEALNTREFCDLVEYFLTKKVVITLHQEAWDEIKSRISGLVLFWYMKFQNQEQQYKFVVLFRRLKGSNVHFPISPYIQEVKPQINKQIKGSDEKIQQKILGLSEQLDEIEKVVLDGEKKINTPSMNTEFVRVLKAKSKILYSISTGGSSFQPQEQDRIKSLYKRLRVILKTTDKKNEQVVKKNKIESQKDYIAKKFNNIDQKKKQETNNLLEDKSQQEQKIQTNSRQEKQSIAGKNLLDIEPATQQRKQSQIISSSKQEGKQKKLLLDDQNPPSQNTENLLTLAESSSTQPKTLDFNKLYGTAEQQKSNLMSDLTSLEIQKQKNEEFTEFKSGEQKNNDLII